MMPAKCLVQCRTQSDRATEVATLAVILRPVLESTQPKTRHGAGTYSLDGEEQLDAGGGEKRSKVYA